MASMDDSILTLDEETMPISSVLVSMGINVKKQNYGTRLKGALDNFNACYLDAMDFLKQILPLAKQHFVQHDAILLPKTPSKKRTRKHLQGNQELNDIIEQNSPPLEDKENIQPNVKLESSEVTMEQPVRRTTRSSKTRTSRKQEETTRQTRNRKRNSLKQDRNRNEDETKPQVTFSTVENKLDKPGEVESEKSTAQMNLKRSSSSSPLLKQRTKRSRSGDTIPVIPSNIVENEMDIPDVSQAKCVGEPLQVLSSDEELDRNEQNLAAKNISNGVLAEGHQAEICEEENELNEAKDEVSEPFINKSDTDIKENQTPDQAEMRKNKRKESGDVDSGEMNAKKRKSEEVIDSVASPVEIKKAMGDENMDLSPCIIPESPVQSEYHAEEAVPITVSSPEEAKVSPLSSCNIAEKVLNQDETQETVSQNEEIRVEEIPPEENKSVNSNAEPVASPQPHVRRSTRSSRRLSKVSLSKRRSSRRLSRANRLSSCSFKKPLSVKKVRDVCSENDPDSGMDCRTSDQGKVSPVLKDLSSTESEDELKVRPIGPSASTPDVEKEPGKSSKKASVKIEQKKQSKGSSSDEMFEPPISGKVGKVAGIVQGINRNTKALDERTNSSVNGTPNGVRKMKTFGSTVTRSSTKPSNLVGGNIRSFINRPSTKKLDPSEIVRQKKIELQRKEEKERERKDQAELRRKNLADEQKRKREEKQKRVAEAKAAREKEEQEKKERQLEEKKKMLHALEQARKKREQEEENKKKLREQRKKEADARRLKENEERLKRLQEKEEDERVYREMFKRKQEHEELERKQKILEEKRQQEQKQRERQREQAEERQRKLREIKEKEQKRAGKEMDEARLLTEKNKEETEKKEREIRLKEAEERETKRIAQLIKEKVAQDKKLYEEKLQKEEKERKEREEERKQREAYKANQFSSAAINKSVQSADSYMMTPPPAQTRKPSTNENYDISDIRSDESTDDEDCPRKRVPGWAQGEALKLAVFNQEEPWKLFEMETGPFVVDPPDLDRIFQKKRKRFYYRTSSAHWDTPPIKKDFLM